MGGGGGGAMSGRAAATAMTKLTWILAIAFIATSITLTILAAQKSSGSSVLDRITLPAGQDAGAADAPSSPLGSDLLPPAQGDNAPLVPSAD
jgi:preprotein translocase subunit SecG